MLILKPKEAFNIVTILRFDSLYPSSVLFQGFECTSSKYCRIFQSTALVLLLHILQLRNKFFLAHKSSKPCNHLFCRFEYSCFSCRLLQLLFDIFHIGRQKQDFFHFGQQGFRRMEFYLSLHPLMITGRKWEYTSGVENRIDRKFKVVLIK